MPLLIIGVIGFGAGFFAGSELSNTTKLILIGGAAYYIYKKVN